MQRAIIVGKTRLHAHATHSERGVFFIGQDVVLTVDDTIIPFDDLSLYIAKDQLVKMNVDETIVQPNGAFDIQLGGFSVTCPPRPGAYCGQECAVLPATGYGALTTVSIRARRNDIVTVRLEYAACP